MPSETLRADHLHTHLGSKTKPIVLRTIQSQDAPSHSAILNASFPPSDPSSKGISVQRSRELIEAQRASAAVPTVLSPDGLVVSGPGRVNMVVVLRAEDGQEGDVVIGLGGFGAIKDWERDGKKIRAGDVGVVIAEEYRGEGYALEAMKMAIDWAFTPVKHGGPQMDLVTVTTLANNTAMLRLTDEKLGLKGKGVLRDAEFGDPAGEMYYELTAEEWDTQ
ncbi:hypothetical protein QQS21_011898 [Conoideocrella luteorostrata]|uniref:N-acetyltransferase domain-containing protein n=1 Tax=Conoideocrella luteorostrata TaxID=1105319 RepID=A0AAJ0CCJ2_9HYPO|nr:hypothetical protein QQS21_011898 [Conoideocrella luteorostrata]